MVALLLAANPVDVRSSTSCPSTEDIVERLEPLLPRSQVKGPVRDVATIEILAAHVGDASTLRLRLLQADGSSIGDRRLPLQEDCTEMASAVATVLAAWETEPAAIMPSGPGFDEHAAPIFTAKRANSGLQVFVGTGGGVALVGGVAAAGQIEVRAGTRLSSWQARVAMAIETSRRLSLAQGYVDWQHATAGLAASWRIMRSPGWLFAVDAGPVAGWAIMQGGGFSFSRHQYSFEYGVGGGFRGGRVWGRWSLWADVRASLWAQGQRATINQGASGVDLPMLDVMASVGVSVLALP